MVNAVTTQTSLQVVREVQAGENVATLHLQEGGPGYLALGDANYQSHLRLARRSQERQHPVGVTFGQGRIIAEIIRADNDVPSQLWEEAGQVRVLFQGHDGAFRLSTEHPQFARVLADLRLAMQQKARVWFIAQKPELALTDVLLVSEAPVASATCNGGGSRAGSADSQY